MPLANPPLSPDVQGQDVLVTCPPPGGAERERSQPGYSLWHVSDADIIYLLGLSKHLFVCVGLSEQQPRQFGTQYGGCGDARLL